MRHREGNSLELKQVVVTLPNFSADPKNKIKYLIGGQLITHTHTLLDS